MATSRSSNQRKAAMAESAKAAITKYLAKKIEISKMKKSKRKIGSENQREA